ncbi:hypothetical protein ACX3P1_23165 [Mesorhizobium sp. A623]
MNFTTFEGFRPPRLRTINKIALSIVPTDDPGIALSGESFVRLPAPVIDLGLHRQCGRLQVAG